MDKRAKLLSGLQQLGSSVPGSVDASHLADLLLSDADLRDLADTNPDHLEDSRSEFLDSASESDDDLEGHLTLLRARELEELGIDALRNRQYEAAVKYLNLARLDWTETFVRRAGSGEHVTISRAALAEEWIRGRYIQLAASGEAFIERKQLEHEFELLSARGKLSTSSCSETSTFSSGGNIK